MAWHGPCNTQGEVNQNRGATMNRNLKRTAVLLIASLASTAHAGLIDHQKPSDRARVATVLERDDVAAELAKLGITREEAKARVATLTDAEVATLARKAGELPAGGAADPVTAMGMALFMVAAISVLAVASVVKLVQYMASNGDTPHAAAN